MGGGGPLSFTVLGRWNDRLVNGICVFSTGMLVYGHMLVMRSSNQQ